MNDSIYTDEMIDACAQALAAARHAAECATMPRWRGLSEIARICWRREACDILSGKKRAKDDYLAHDVVIAVAREMGWPRRET